MADDGKKRPQGRPDYKVYRSRRRLLSRFRKPDLSGLRDALRAPSARRPEKPGKQRDPGRAERHEPGRRRAPGLPRPRGRRVLKWVGLAALGWALLGLLAFAVSAQLQSFKLSGEAKSTLHGNPFLLVNPQTILVLGTDARPPDTLEPGAAPTEECFEQQAHGDVPHGECSVGEFRADTLMLVRVGGGTFRKLSIPRDTYAEIPGQSQRKINAAYAFGGAGTQIEAVEGLLDIDVDHVAIVDFTGFEDLIDAVGGVVVDVPTRLCAEVSGGVENGGWTLRLRRGENTLDGEDALVYARVRKPSPCPGPAPSAYSLGYDDIDRQRAQQAVISGIKDRLTDPLRLPYNFLKGPIIGWEAPKAFVGDMGFLAMPQLVLAAAIGGDSAADVLCSGENAGCTEGPEGSIEVPESERRRAADRLIG